MIVAENPKPEIHSFKMLMEKTDRLLNSEAQKKGNKFKTHLAQKLEVDVCEALKECSKGTEFENTIQLVSGSSFPDIVAASLYGVEVKSTEKNHWTSTGSSILESTRVKSVERIYMTFGKLGGNPVEFKSRPYEECLSEIAVTHYPRYKIDMNLKSGETIFDKMKVSYDDLRNMKNPVEPVARYYKAKLNDGETLWWAPDSFDREDGIQFSAKLFKNLDFEEKSVLTAKMLVLFPSLFRENDNTKYEQPALWLVTNSGVTTSSMRDIFSAGGKEEFRTKSGVIIRMPAIFRRVKKHKELISSLIENAESSVLFKHWQVKIDSGNRLYQWCCLCAKNYSGGNTVEYGRTLSVMRSIFNFYEIEDIALKIASPNS